MNHKWKLLNFFKELCTKALTNHYTTLHDNLEADGLVERVVRIVKRGLLLYRLF